MRQHMLLHGLEIALDGFLGVALLEFGNQRGNEQGAKIAFYLTDIGRQLLHELPLPQHHRAKLLHNLILTVLQILALLLTEVFELFLRHGTIVSQWDKGDVARGVSLNAKTVFTCHAAKGFLDATHLALVFFAQLTLLFFKRLLTKGFGERLTEMRHETFHILPQLLPLARMQG